MMFNFKIAKKEIIIYLPPPFPVSAEKQAEGKN